MQCQISNSFDAVAHRVPVQLLYEAALIQPNSSLIVSPFSVLMSLAVLYLGAGRASNTYNDLTNFLADSSKDRMEIVDHYVKFLQSPGVQLFNGLYFDKTVTPNHHTTSIMQIAFHASLRLVNFGGNVDEAIEEINADIAAKTNQNIPRLLDAGAVDSTTKMMLVNVLSLTAQWEELFSPSKTQPRLFYTANGGQKKVPMMSGTRYFKYNDADDAVTLFGIPYEEYINATMYILLPKRRYGLPSLLKSLRNGCKCLNKMFDTARFYTVDATIPKFEIESKTDILPILSKLSLGSLAGYGADFSLLDDSESLSVGAVVQKATIRVNELGTKAFAGTFSPLVSKLGFDSDAKQFVADHPFAYFIVAEMPAGRQILFNGVVADFPGQ